MRKIACLIALAVATAGCGDSLAGVGDLSRRFVHGDEPATTRITAPPGPDLALSSIASVVWVNDELDLTGSEDRERLVRDVWARGDLISPFVQASRWEIAMALPGLQIPTLAPEDITHVSSQLVYDPQTALLDLATSAAFGFWTAEPYSVPRSESQLLVLRVGIATVAESAQAGEIAQFNVEGGRELAWVQGGFVYQLFCRTGVIEEACFAIAESMTPLSLLTMLRDPAGDDAEADGAEPEPAPLDGDS